VCVSVSAYVCACGVYVLSWLGECVARNQKFSDR